MQLKPLTLILSSILCTSIANANTTKPAIASKAVADPQAVINYWTPERMQQATPMDLPTVTQTAGSEVPVDQIMQKYKGQKPDTFRTPPTAKITPNEHPLFKPTTIDNPVKPADAGTLQEQFSSQPLVPIYADRTYPYTTVGKLFFTTPSGNKTCSGAVIANRIIATAAHCINSGSSTGWYTNWVFVPAYRSGSAPFEVWVGSNAVISSNWISSNGTIPNAADYGVIAFNDMSIAGTTYNLASVVGKLGFQTLSTMPNHAHLLGYPANLDSGNQMHQVTAQSVLAVAPSNAEYGSDMSTGAGGGPWIQNFGPASTGTVAGSNPGRNLMVGITSYGYNDTTHFGNGSTILDSGFTSIYNYMCGLATGNC